MLGDARSKALVANFAEQWLHLRNLKNSAPDLGAFELGQDLPHYDPRPEGVDEATTRPAEKPK